MHVAGPRLTSSPKTSVAERPVTDTCEADALREVVLESGIVVDRRGVAPNVFVDKLASL